VRGTERARVCGRLRRFFALHLTGGGSRPTALWRSTCRRGRWNCSFSGDEDYLGSSTPAEPFPGLSLPPRAPPPSGPSLSGVPTIGVPYWAPPASGTPRPPVPEASLPHASPADGGRRGARPPSGSGQRGSSTLLGRVNAAPVVRALNQLGADPFCQEVICTWRSSGRCSYATGMRFLCDGPCASFWQGATGRHRTPRSVFFGTAPMTSSREPSGGFWQKAFPSIGWQSTLPLRGRQSTSAGSRRPLLALQMHPTLVVPRCRLLPLPPVPPPPSLAPPWVSPCSLFPPSPHLPLPLIP